MLKTNGVDSLDIVVMKSDCSGPMSGISAVTHVLKWIIIFSLGMCGHAAVCRRGGMVMVWPTLANVSEESLEKNNGDNLFFQKC